MYNCTGRSTILYHCSISIWIWIQYINLYVYWGFGRGMESVDRFIPIPILVRIWHFTVLYRVPTFQHALMSLNDGDKCGFVLFLKTHTLIRSSGGFLPGFRLLSIPPSRFRPSGKTCPNSALLACTSPRSGVTRQLDQKAMYEKNMSRIPPSWKNPLRFGPPRNTRPG